MSGSGAPVRALLDTTYFLPAFGIAVRCLEPGSLLELRRLALRGAVELYYADFMWLELMPNVVREASNRGVDAESRQGGCQADHGLLLPAPRLAGEAGCGGGSSPQAARPPGYG